ncbi:hypothetical protein AB0D14_39940 [Streptomyces sp. NPDC048484]|uniref:hypothetical protein n=1 Tax=Streptomyces sp. NPDC048484 TaxID=3155146 RepID=UPI0034410BBB
MAASIWNADLAAGWEMNSDVADVLSQATGQILQCSEVFALAPRPPGFLPGVGYLLSYWKNLKDYSLVARSRSVLIRIRHPHDHRGPTALVPRGDHRDVCDKPSYPV